ncbi:MAG: hypothetical protein QM589_16195 [Thermomicrobiales bacterium]
MVSSLTDVGAPRSPKHPRVRIPRKLPESSLEEIVAAASSRGRHLANRIARRWRDDPILVMWQIATAPLWVGSGVPIPDRPLIPTLHRDGDASLEDVAQSEWLYGQMRALTDRFWLAWIASATLRGIALGAVACMLWTLGAIQAWLPQPRMLPFVAVVILGALVGLAFGLVNRPSVPRVATMLDRTFALHERMITAFTPSPGDLSPRIRGIQLADAANAFEEIRADVRGAAVLPLREMVIAGLAGIALITTLLFNIASTGIPQADPVQIPAFVPSSERFAREAQEQKAQQLADAAKQPPAAAAPETTPGSSESAGELGGLRAVGNALGTNPVTEPSASSIAQGDFPGAKNQLEQNAQAAASLPQAERDALADELDRAADGMEDGDLKDATRKAADGLREGGDAAVTGLNDLADQIGKSGEQATTQGQASESGLDQQSSAQTSSSQSGQNGQGGDSGQGAQSGNSGNAQSSDASAGAPQGDPGSGVAAAPGIGSDPSGDGQGQQSDGSGSQSGSSQDQAGQAGQAGQSGQQGQAGQSSGASSQGDGSQPGGTTSGQPGSSGQSSDSGSNPSGSDASGSQGSGTSSGTSSGNPSDAKQGGGDGGSEQKPSDTAQDGKASSNPPPGDSQQSSSSGDAQPTTGGNETLVLQGTSDDSGVATGNDTGSSSSGSGSGAGAASGSAKQGAVGPAGPDSNRVPERYRDLVKAYFDGDGLPPDEDQP